MSYQLLGHVVTLVAAEDLSSSIHCAVVVNSDGEFELASAGGAVTGILTSKAVSGSEAPAQFSGVAQWKLGGTVAPGDAVKSDASGRAVTASAADLAAGIAKGICLEGGDSGELGAILLLPTASGFAGGGYEDVALDTGAISVLTKYTYFSIADTKSAALAAGIFVGQEKILVCDATSGTPAGTVTGTFLSQAGAAGTSLAFNAAADMAKLVWTGAAWRVVELTSVTLS